MNFLLGFGLFSGVNSLLVSGNFELIFIGKESSHWVHLMSSEMISLAYQETLFT